jgi:hypothetical protein
VADPTLGSLTKEASCVSNDWKVCIINLCFWHEISRFSCNALLFYFLLFSSCLKDIILNTTIKYHIFLWASRVKSVIWHIFCISKPSADRGKLVLFLETAGQIYPETGLTFEAPKCVSASVIKTQLCFKKNITWYSYMFPFTLNPYQAFVQNLQNVAVLQTA